jgi:hypothetical protein
MSLLHLLGEYTSISFLRIGPTFGCANLCIRFFNRLFSYPLKLLLNWILFKANGGFPKVLLKKRYEKCGITAINVPAVEQVHSVFFNLKRWQQASDKTDCRRLVLVLRVMFFENEFLIKR